MVLCVFGSLSCMVNQRNHDEHNMIKTEAFLAPMSTPLPTPLTGNSMLTVYYLQQILSLDTYYVSSDKGNMTITLNGVNISKLILMDDLHQQAEKYINFMLSGKEVFLEFDEDSKTEPINVYLYVEGAMLNKNLIEKGFAEVDPNIVDNAQMESLLAAQSVAKTNKIGIWSMQKDVKHDLNEVISTIEPIGCGTLPCKPK